MALSQTLAIYIKMGFLGEVPNTAPSSQCKLRGYSLGSGDHPVRQSSVWNADTQHTQLLGNRHLTSDMYASLSFLTI